MHRILSTLICLSLILICTAAIPIPVETTAQTPIFWALSISFILFGLLLDTYRYCESEAQKRWLAGEAQDLRIHEELELIRHQDAVIAQILGGKKCHQ